MGVVHGAQGPLLERTLKEKLEHVHKVIKGEAERNAVCICYYYCSNTGNCIIGSG